MKRKGKGKALRKRSSPVEGGNRAVPLRMALAAIILLLLGLVVFRDFVFGSKLLLYKDIGSDSLNANLPYFIHLSDYVRSHGIPSWSFAIGLGQSLFSFASWYLIHPIVWLPRDIIAGGLVYEHLLKSVAVGILFLTFLELRGVNFRAALAGAGLLSYSAYLCSGACWAGNTDEALCFTFLLFSAEEAVKRGRWVFLVLAVGLIAVVNVFYLYLCALMLSFYVPFRFIELNGWKPMHLTRICVVLALVAVLGIGLGAIGLLDNAVAVFNSPRGSGTTSYSTSLSSHAMFGFESSLHYFTALLRPLSNDMLGTGSQFLGWQNYFEAPPTYCGILCLLLLPQVFVGATARQRTLYGIFLIAIVVPVIFPWFRYLFWAFQGDYYRAFSLFSILGIIALSMTVFSRFMDRGALNLWALGATSVVLLAVLYFPNKEMQALINPGPRKVATLLLLAYPALLAVGQLLKRQSSVAMVIIGLSVVEMAYFDRITLANRPTVSKGELAERVGYNDHTVEAVRDIDATDHDFFRISKYYFSGPAIHGSLNDALVFGYYGTTSYNSFNNLNYIKFLIAMDALPPNPTEIDTRWLGGLLGRPLLSTFAGEKYVLTREPVPFQTSEDYSFIKRYGDVYAFQNRFALPLGIAFTRYISESVFLKLAPGVKEVALFHVAVLSEDAAEAAGPIPMLSAEELEQLVAEVSTGQAIEERRETALRISSFEQTKIAGTISAKEWSLLVFQTPFDSGWRCLTDGKRTPVVKADVGLLGVPVPPGEHEVTLRFTPRFLVLGSLISLVSLTIFVICLWRWPRVRLPDPAS